MAGYNIFSQMRGPQINESLFVSAKDAGARTGMVVPTELSAAVSGLQEGIQTGQKIATNQQQMEMNQIAIEQAPLKQQALETDIQTADINNQIKMLELQVAKETEDITKNNYKLELEKKQADLSRQVQDISLGKKYGEAISSNNTDAQRQILNDPDFVGWFGRNSKEGEAVLGRIRPILNNQEKETADRMVDYTKSLDADARLRQQNLEATQRQAEKLQDLYDKTQSRPGIAEFASGYTNPKDLYENVEPKALGGGSYEIFDANGNSRGVVAKEDIGPLLEFRTAYKASTQITNLEAGRNADDQIGQAPAKPTPTPAPAAIPSLTTAPKVASATSPAGQNATIQEQVDSTFAAKRSAAEAKGQGDYYSKQAAIGQTLVNKAPPPNPVTTPQNVEVPPTQLRLTNPLTEEQNNFFNEAFGTATEGVYAQPPIKGKAQPLKAPEVIQKKVNYLLGDDRAEVSPELLRASTSRGAPSIGIINQIAQMPELEGYSPLIKGMVAIESRGNPFAVSPAGAGGLMQLMPGTAGEMGLEGQEVFDANKNVAAGAAYFQKQVNAIQKSLAIETDKTGLPIALDLRFALAAYNGGLRHVKNGIAAGNYTWPEMKEYLKAVKGPRAAKENTEYPDKVMAATIAFMKGGNLVDDGIMKHLITHGMVSA
jgi:soluble lytic murein transglycosylase-like protein